MKFYSEKTKKFYESAEACVDAEEKFDAEQAKLKEKRAEEARIRKERAKEVEEAYLAAEKAREHYIAVRNKFIEDHGSFHMTISKKDSMLPTSIDDIFRMFFY